MLYSLLCTIGSRVFIGTNSTGLEVNDGAKKRVGSRESRVLVKDGYRSSVNQLAFSNQGNFTDHWCG